MSRLQARRAKERKVRGQTWTAHQYRPRQDHVVDPECWCKPEVIFEDSETGSKVWRHVP